MRDKANKVTHYCKQFFLFVLILCSFGEVQGNGNATMQIQQDTQRYLALLLLNLSVERGIDADLIPMAHNNGLNVVYITIPWDKVYFSSPTDKPKWEKYDEQVQLATSLGMKVALRIHLARNVNRTAGFWDVQDFQYNHVNKPMDAGYHDGFFQFNHEPSILKATAFIKEVVERYKYLQTNKNLLFVSVTTTSEQESGYQTNSWIDGKESAASFDYSGPVTKGFQEWLKTNYKKIERLNFLWGGSYKSFSEAAAPSDYGDPHKSFRGRYGKDWYIYRHIVLKQFINKMIVAVKSVDPTIKYMADYGSIFDGISANRGTLAYKDLNEKADGIKVNDDLTNTDHRLSVDFIRSESRPDMLVGNEMFYNTGLDNATNIKQINENFENGANFVAILLSTVQAMQRAESILKESSARWLNDPIKPIVYTDSIGVRLSSAVEKGGSSDVIWSEYSRKAYADPSKPKPIFIHLEEDLFTSDYWKDAANHNPYVYRPIPMQIIPINKDFSYKLPSDTFADVDGTIVQTEVYNLPSWLKYESGVLKGKPTVLGDYRLQVKGIDDDGGFVEAIFTVRVDTRENANRPPTVNTTLINQLTAVNKAFSFKIPANAFLDNDGEITKVEASELPAWLKYANGVLSGTPIVLGEYRIILKAYDDLNAFVETYFTISVVEPQFLNNTPYVNSGLPIKYINVGQPFTYNFPANICGDTDGYISSVTLQNRPPWLEFSQNVFSGTPPEEGEYRLIMRAYDNGGAFVETTFILRVEIPRLRFEIVRGGRAVDQQILRSLEGNDVIPYDSLPPLINIYAYGNFVYDHVKFDLNGPYRRSSSTSKFPYAFFDNDKGFAPYVGRYTLTVTATNKDSSAITNSIQFSISSGDSLHITKDLKEWQFYPNPVESIFNIKLPETQTLDQVQYFIITSTGKSIPVPARLINVQDQLINLDIAGMNLSSGIYLVHVKSNGAVLKQFRIFKH